MSARKCVLGALAALAATAVLPVVATAPKATPIAPDGVTTVEETIEACRESGLGGWELVDHATQLVHRKYSHYSCYHWWESPVRSFARSRGQANQYNNVLSRVLKALGFRVRTVHAARVRLQRSPWWHAGHTWLEVTVDGRTRDVCASRAETRAGEVMFIPVSTVRPFRGLTYLDTTLGLAPIVTVLTWRSWIERSPLPRWMYRPFDEAASPEGWPGYVSHPMRGER